MTVLKVKSGAGGTWEEVGGIGLGVPAGGTTGQVLTKTSAADYATAWGTNQPILANNASLQGHKADGTTVQNLIGMTAADEISIGPSLAAGKNIYVPRLTVQGPVTLQDQQYVLNTGGQQIVYPYAAGGLPGGEVYFVRNCSAVFNADAGSTWFFRDVRIDGTLTKGVVAYTHPGAVLERHYTGRVERFRASYGAAGYEGRRSFEALDRFLAEECRLPTVGTIDRLQVFERCEELTMGLEEAYLYLLDLHARVRALEGHP